MSERTQREELTGEIVVYETPDGAARVEVVIGDETVWLTQRQMADLFDTTVANISLHARNAYLESGAPGAEPGARVRARLARRPCEASRPEPGPRVVASRWRSP